MTIRFNMKPKPATDRPGILEWIALLIVLVHGTQAAFDVINGPKGSATMNVSAADLLLAVGFFFWIIRRITRLDFSWPHIGVALLAVLCMLLSLIPKFKGGDGDINTSFGKGLKETLQFVEYFIVAYVVFGEAFRTELMRRRAMFMLGIAVLFAIVVAAVQYGRGVPVLQVRGSWFQDRNTFGMFLALSLPMLFGVSIFAYGALRRLIVAILIFAALCVILAGGPFLALCVGLLVVAALRGRARFLITAIALLLACGLLLHHLPRQNNAILIDSVALYKADDPYGVFTGQNALIPNAQAELTAKREALTNKILNNEPVTSFSETFSERDFIWRWQQRWMEWQAAVNMIVRSPWFGVGAGAYQLNVGAFYGDMPKYPKNLMEPDALSFYMVWCASIGVPFMILFFLMLLRSARNAGFAYYDAVRAPFDHGLAAGLLGSLAAFLVGAVFTDPLVRGVGITAALILALALALRDAENRA